jgi:hypothetical protein
VCGEEVRAVCGDEVCGLPVGLVKLAAWSRKYRGPGRLRVVAQLFWDDQAAHEIRHTRMDAEIQQGYCCLHKTLLTLNVVCTYLHTTFVDTHCCLHTTLSTLTGGAGQAGARCLPGSSTAAGRGRDAVPVL